MQKTLLFVILALFSVSAEKAEEAYEEPVLPEQDLAGDPDYVDPAPHTVTYDEELVIDNDLNIDEHIKGEMHHDNDQYPAYNDNDVVPGKEEGDDHYYNHILDDVDPVYNEGHHEHGYG